MKETIFSEEQKQAVGLFEEDLVVFAGAGSGKTTLLVERFFYAITKQKIAPENILAITFTEKAAHEMKSRLVGQCEVKGLSHLRQELESAAIGTIHSFCARVLRENPIESGLDPFFRIMSDGEARMLIEKTLDRLFEDEAGNAGWLEMLADYGEESLRQALKSFYETSRASAGASKIFECAAPPVELKRSFTELATFLGGTLRSLRSQDLSGAEEKLKSVLEELERCLKPRTGREKGMLAADAWSRFKELDKRSKKTKEDVVKLESLLKRWMVFYLEDVLLPAKRQFIKILLRFKALYESEKRKKASYDFEDLVTFVYELFSDEKPASRQVLKRYQELYACILVDEYQDTSPLQARIVDCLKDKNRVFYVGDAQQSIYGFRHADPWIFRRFTEGTRYKKVHLSRNHRSRREILEWVNLVFAKDSERSGFRRLEAARDFIIPKPHSLEVIAVSRDAEKIPSLERARVAEARILASRIRELVTSKMPVEDKGTARPVRYRDFAMLFRSTTSSYLYEQELGNAGIPFTVLKGKGFYEKPEVMDILCCLDFLEDPADDISLACVLRSPLAALSDDGLFWLASSVKEGGLEKPLCEALHKLDRIPQLSAPDRSVLRQFNVWSEALRRQKDRMKLSELVRKVLLDTRYEAKVLTQKEGGQKLANLRKLLELARTFEERELAGISDFTRTLKALSAEEVPEAEAPVESGAGDVVTISTVHAAKGLEFPCVVIADMGGEKKKGGLGPVIAHPVTGLGMKWIDPLTRKLIADYTYLEIEKQRSEKEAEEDERVLYVAMTRAKEHLILSGALPFGKTTGSSWMEKILPVLGEEALVSGTANGIRIQAVKEMPPVQASPFGIRLADELGLREGVLKKEAVHWEAVAGIDYDARLSPLLKEYTQTRDMTVTDVLTASLKPSDKDGISLEEDGVPDPEEEEPKTPRNEYGTLFHKLMEIVVSERSKSIRAKLFDAPFLGALGKAERAQIKKDVLGFWKGPWGRAVREAKKCYPELPFIYKTRHGVLKGQIDLVFQTPAGEWVILDYKTNRVTQAGKKALAEQYEIQLGVYALVFSRLYGEIPRKGMLYFSALGESHEFRYDAQVLERLERGVEARFKEALTAES